MPSKSPGFTLALACLMATAWGAPAWAASSPHASAVKASQAFQLADAEEGSNNLIHTPNAPDDPAPPDGPPVNKAPVPGNTNRPSAPPSDNLIHTPNAPDDPAPSDGPALVKEKQEANPNLAKEPIVPLEDLGSLLKEGSGPIPQAPSWLSQAAVVGLGGLTSGVPVAYLAAGDGMGAFRSGILLNLGLGAALAGVMFSTDAMELASGDPTRAERVAWKSLTGPSGWPILAIGSGASALGVLDLAGKASSGSINGPVVLGAGLGGAAVGSLVTLWLMPMDSSDAQQRRKR